MRFALIILFTLGCYSVSPKAKKTVDISFKPGLYTPVKPSILESKVFSKKYNSLFGNPIIIAIDFKADSSYRIIGCSRKVLHTGNWKVSGDSILLHNRIISDSIHAKDSKLFYNGEYLFYPVKFVDSSKYKFKTFTTLLKIGGEVFNGREME